MLADKSVGVPRTQEDKIVIYKVWLEFLFQLLCQRSNEGVLEHGLDYHYEIEVVNPRHISLPVKSILIEPGLESGENKGM